VYIVWIFVVLSEYLKVSWLLNYYNIFSFW